MSQDDLTNLSYSMVLSSPPCSPANSTLPHVFPATRPPAPSTPPHVFPAIRPPAPSTPPHVFPAIRPPAPTTSHATPAHTQSRKRDHGDTIEEIVDHIITKRFEERDNDQEEFFLDMKQQIREQAVIIQKQAEEIEELHSENVDLQEEVRNLKEEMDEIKESVVGHGEEIRTMHGELANVWENYQERFPFLY